MEIKKDFFFKKLGLLNWALFKTVGYHAKHGLVSRCSFQTLEGRDVW